MEKVEKFDYESFRQSALEAYKSGKPLMGKEGIFTPLLKEFLEGALEGELDAHLDEAERKGGNRRNGVMKKQVKSSQGSFELSTPRDRSGSFEPQIVSKRQTYLGEDLDNKIIRLYARGMSYEGISEHLAEVYGLEISSGKISAITDKVLPRMEEWRNRVLERVYSFVYLDAIFYKIREDGRVKNKAVYNLIGVNLEGEKSLLGLYISETESASFWLSVLTDLQNRGVEDILIACIDNLSGFSEAIATIFPKTDVQLCIVHQIRNSLRYVTSEDMKKVAGDLKPIYQAANEDLAVKALSEFEDKWGVKYPALIKSWYRNWERLTTFFRYPPPIRRAIYTNNAIEGFHRQLRQHTKNKGVFPSDTALLKLLFLLSENITQKWTLPLSNWALVIGQFSILFEERLKPYIKF